MAVSDDLRGLLLSPAEAAAMDAPGSTDAAVLIALYPRDDQLVAVFTERRGDLRRHAGEISFPGGRRDEHDEDLRTTALREAEEEIGLDPGAVELLGALPPVGTLLTGYRVFPFVGSIAAGHVWSPQEAEVAEVLELSLRELIAGHTYERLWGRGVPVRTPTYTVRSRGGPQAVTPRTHFVWGATARIVESLLERLAPLLQTR